MNIQDLIPFMKEGWIAMDKDNSWYWYKNKPMIKDEKDSWCPPNNTLYGSLEFLKIKPVEDWTKSLIKVG